MNSKLCRRATITCFTLVTLGLIGMGMNAAWPAIGQDAAVADKSAAAPLRPQNAYFFFDAELHKDGDRLPQPPFFPNPWKEPDAEHPKRGKVVADPTAPQGKHVFRWDVAEPNTKEVFHEIKFARVPEAKPKDYYYAFFVRFDRKDGKDIWHDASVGPEADSLDKAFEVVGDGIRWVVHL